MKRGWVIYAGVLSAAVILGEAVDLVQGKPVTLAAVANWVVTAVLLIATWCYGLQKPLHTEFYWRAAFWIIVFVTLLGMVRVALAGRLGLYVALVSLAFVVPAFVAAYRYAYRSGHLWPPRPPSR
jgi:hypothetical protein